MNLKRLKKSLLKDYAFVSNQKDKTPKQLLAQCEESFHQTCRDAEVEEILAENVAYGSPIPGDVTDDEIQAAIKRFKNNTIFRLDWGRYVSHGISFTQANRKLVLNKAASNKPFERDFTQLSRSAILLGTLKSH